MRSLLAERNFAYAGEWMSIFDRASVKASERLNPLPERGTDTEFIRMPEDICTTESTISAFTTVMFFILLSTVRTSNRSRTGYITNVPSE